MLIEDQLRLHTKSGDLVHWQPGVPSIGCYRHVYVSSAVNSLLNDTNNPDPKLARTIGRTRAKVDTFCSGNKIVFALDPYRKSPASLVSRNRPERLGIVELRPTAPTPDLRVFGGFAAVDVLVLLTWAYKTGIDYKAEVKSCSDEWNKFFSKRPIVGATHADYLSHNFVPG